MKAVVRQITAKMAKDYLGKDQRSVRPDDEKEEKPTKALDAGDIALLKTYVCCFPLIDKHQKD